MNYDFICGLDVSKLSLDLCLIDTEGHQIDHDKIANDSLAIKKWIQSLEKQYPDSWILFCLEPTGHYSNIVSAALLSSGKSVWLANPSDIRMSIGMKRGKNDRIDAQRIAEYGFRFQDKVRLLTSNQVELQELSQLLTYRELLVADKGKYVGQLTDYPDFLKKSVHDLINQVNRKLVKELEQQIARIDQQIEAYIDSHNPLKEQYNLLLSIPGVGKILAQTLIAYTAGFTRFTTARQLACHAGVAPYEYSSGTSIKNKRRVSHRANKRLKSLFHMAALSVIRSKGELQEYYLRKVGEGKSKLLVLNAIRNKLIHRIFAVLLRGEVYKKFA